MSPVDCEWWEARQLVGGQVSTAISRIYQTANHEAALGSTNHDWFGLFGIVHNPEPVLCPSEGDIQTFELPKLGSKASDV
jgi:hypothetical protein